RRADDQRRTLRGEDPRRRLDRRYPRQVAVGAVRAFDRRHRRRLRNLHAVAQGLAPPALRVSRAAMAALRPLLLCLLLVALLAPCGARAAALDDARAGHAAQDRGDDDQAIRLYSA